jgi:hypothetical protein
VVHTRCNMQHNITLECNKSLHCEGHLEGPTCNLGLLAHYSRGSMPASDAVADRLCELREEAYCKVLKCFVVSQTYDLVRPCLRNIGTQLSSLLCINA